MERRSQLRALGKVGRRKPQRSQRGKQRGGCSQTPGDYDFDGDFDVDDGDDDDVDNNNDNYVDHNDDDFDNVYDDDDDDNDDDKVKYVREAEAEKKTNAGNTGKSITNFHTFHLQNVMSKSLKASTCKISCLKA